MRLKADTVFLCFAVAGRSVLRRAVPLVLLSAGLALGSGCVTAHEMTYGVDHPILELSSLGLKFDGRFVKPEEVPELLEEYQIPHDATIHIGITSDVMQQLGPVRTFQAYLAKKGYRRSVMVTDMHGESATVDRSGPGFYRGGSAAPQARPKIRYKGANE